MVQRHLRLPCILKAFSTQVHTPREAYGLASLPNLLLFWQTFRHRGGTWPPSTSPHPTGSHLQGVRGRGACAAEEERPRPWLLHDGTGNPFPWPSPQVISFLPLPRLLATAEGRRTREWHEHHACRGSNLCMRGENQGKAREGRKEVVAVQVHYRGPRMRLANVQVASKPVSLQVRSDSCTAFPFFQWSCRPTSMLCGPAAGDCVEEKPAQGGACRLALAFRIPNRWAGQLITHAGCQSVHALEGLLVEHPFYDPRRCPAGLLEMWTAKPVSQPVRGCRGRVDRRIRFWPRQLQSDSSDRHMLSHGAHGKGPLVVHLSGRPALTHYLVYLAQEDPLPTSNVPHDIKQRWPPRIALFG